MEDVVKVATLNLTKICRVCLNESEVMHSLFSELDNEYDLEEDLSFVYEILTNLCSIKILAEDGLPTMICSNCMQLALVSYKFQQQCNRSQVILEAYITHSLVDITEVTDSSHESIKDVTKDDSSLFDNDKLDVNSLVSNTNEEIIENDQLETNLENFSYENLDRSPQVDKPKKCNLYDFEHILLNKEDGALLDAAKVAASEDNIKLREKLAVKRLLSSSAKGKLLKKRESIENLSYTVKQTSKVEKIYACNFCEKTYKYSSSLKIHLRTHTLEKPYSCKICGKSFNQYGSLIYHHRSHTGEQPYACKICGKRYKQSGTLTAHMRIHTGQRPFLCSVCGRGFRQAPDLSYHMRTHTKEKPYMCNVCGKTMSMQCHLVQHMRTHTGERPFKCLECTKAFPSSTRLKRHAIIHTGLKPYKCDVCDKSFNRRSSLMVHSKIHTDERPHTCPICGKGFIQAHALRGHVLTHSSEQYELKIE